MRALVTGTAGFIGSHLSEALLDAGHEVIGVDAITPYYDTTAKWANLQGLLKARRFTFIQRDLRRSNLDSLVRGMDVVFHLAGQPGVRPSWENGFGAYAEHNVIATQRLLEACRHVSIERFVYASSSSVYGNAAAYPTREDDLPAPHSPYGVTKLAGEHLCALYAANYGLPATMLRYFTFYGPRQRPDMGIHRFIESAINGDPLPLYGDGQQVRDFTYVGDVVDATAKAGMATELAPGTVLNIAGGSATTVNELIELISTKVGCDVNIERKPPQAGDVQATGGSVARARSLLGWAPRVGLADGVALQAAWHLSRAACASDEEQALIPRQMDRTIDLSDRASDQAVVREGVA